MSSPINQSRLACMPCDALALISSFNTRKENAAIPLVCKNFLKASQDKQKSAPPLLLRVSNLTTATCSRIDKLGANEKWIPSQLLANANDKEVHLFQYSHENVIYLFFSKNKELRCRDFSPSLRKILEKNSMIKQRISMCFYASAYLHAELPDSSVIAMGFIPWKDENCLIEYGMDHHQLLYNNKDEYIIIDPTWPRFESYHSIVILASNQDDLDEMYTIAFGRSYEKTKPMFRNMKDISISLDISC